MTRSPAVGILDLGASGGRVFALVQEADGLRLMEISRFEHAPQRTWQRSLGAEAIALRTCWDWPRIYAGLIDGLAALGRCDDLDVRSFGIDTWGSDGVWLNAAGDMLGLIGTGRDGRWQIAQAEIAQRLGHDALFRLTGTRSEPFCVANQLYWYAHHEPKLVEAAATYMPVGSLLQYFLCGERAAEYTWMSTTQLVRPGQFVYCREAFDRLELPLAKMPRLVRPGTRLGRSHREVAADLPLTPFEVIVPAMHDTASAYVAAPVVPGRKSILISSGTWTLAGIGRPEPLISDAVAAAPGLTNIGGCEEVYFHAVIMGTWLAQELRRIWSTQDGLQVDWQTLSRWATEASTLGTILDIDHALFRAPLDMEAAIGEFCRQTGQAAPAGRGALVRAAYEGLALKIAVACERMQTLSGARADEILLLGGGTRNPLLNQWIADASGLPVRTGSENATALGNGLIQAQALGWLGSLEQGRESIRQGVAEHVYEPHPDADWAGAKEKLRAWTSQ
jgi:rhamnulokinase